MNKMATVRFDIIWRRTVGGDMVLATVTHEFVPNATNVILFETDLIGVAAPASPGDDLVLKFTTVSGVTGAYYIPNGDGDLVNGRTVNITLPPVP